MKKLLFPYMGRRTLKNSELGGGGVGDRKDMKHVKFMTASSLWWHHIQKNVHRTWENSGLLHGKTGFSSFIEVRRQPVGKAPSEDMKHDLYFLHLRSSICATHGRGESVSRPETFLYKLYCLHSYFITKYWITLVCFFRCIKFMYLAHANVLDVNCIKFSFI